VRHFIVILSVLGVSFVGCSGAAVPPTGGATTAPSAVPVASTEPSPSSDVMPTLEPTPDELRYVALGDSYTIGTGVRPAKRWPDQLVRALRPDIELELTRNLGVNGYTSQQVIEEELPLLAGLDAELVSVLIGVNDVVRGVPPETYRANVRLILDRLLEDLAPDRIFVVATPDYTRTPRGAEFGDPAAKRSGIERVNAIMEEEAMRRDIAFVDITPVSDGVGDDPTLVASDGLHPSGKQYGGWVEVIAPVVRRMLIGD
jgi:acyl-CoA thioesterase I